MSDLLPNVPDKVIDLLPNIPDKSKVDLLPDLPNINVDLLPNLPDKDKDTSLTKTITRPFKAQAFKTAEAFSRGVAGFSERVDKISKFIEQTTGLSRGGLFEESAKIWNANADKWGRRADEIGVNVVDEVIGEATGGAIPGISEFLLGVPFAAAAGAAEAEEKGISPATGAIVEGTKRALLGRILKQVSFLKQPLRAGAFGSTFAAQAVGEGGDVKEITKSFVIGSLYSVGGRGQIGLREITRNLKPKKSPEGVKSMELIKKRSVNIDKATLDSEAFITKLEVEMKPLEREAVPFIRQGIKDPEILRAIGKEDLIPIIENPSPKLRGQVEKIGKYYDEAFTFLKDNWGDVSFVENYVTQMWNIPKNRKSEVINHFATINPFIKKRTIPTLEEGIKLGLTPKTTDIAELLRIYDQHKIKTVYNHKFAEELKGLTDDRDFQPLIKRADKAPNDWVLFDHPALNRATAIGKTQVKVPVKETVKTIRDSVEKIKTITIEVAGGKVTKQQGNGAIRKMEEVMRDALESRGMTKNEANVYLGKLKTVYAGAETEAFIGRERTSETQRNKRLNETIEEIERVIKVDVPVLAKIPVKVHPEIAQELRIIFSNPYSSKAINALETINAFTKKSMLSLSFFHHFALTESAFSSGIGREVVKLWNPYKIYNSLKKKDFEIFKKQEMAKDAIDHGIKFGALPDVQIARVNKALKDIEFKSRNIPLLKQTTTKIRQANQLWDRALWDYYHNTLKLEAYEKQVAREIKRKNPQSTKEITDIKKQVAEFVNDSFGGQNWDLSKTFGSPKMKQIMHWALLSPDWTISTLKQAAAPIRGVTTGKATTTFRGTLFWIRAALYYNIIAQSANHYMTEKLEGEGRFTWDNPPGHKLNVFWGFNEDGSERYLRMGKQFREAYEWMAEPLNKLGGKLSPVLREGIRQIAKTDPGSGFPTSFAEYQEFWSWRNFTARAASLATLPIPFSLKSHIQDTPHNFLFTLPASRGMTKFKTVELYKEALKRGDGKAIRDIYIHALRNSLDADILLKSASTFVKSDITYEAKDMANDIWKELRDLQDKGQPNLNKLNKPQKQLLKEYNRQKILNPKVNKELLKIQQQWLKVIQLQKEHGVQGTNK